MPQLPELIDFDSYAPVEVVTRMRELAKTRDGWVNLQPLIDEADVPQMSVGVLGWISAKGPAVPEATWVPGEKKRNGEVAPDSIGLQHRGGPRARATLAEAGAAIPAGWKLLSDHPKRGIVVQLPDDTDPKDVVDWLTMAARILSPMELPSQWVAAIFRR